MKEKSSEIGQYPSWLINYFKHKPWDLVHIPETIIRDKTGLIEKASECSSGMHHLQYRHDGQPARNHPEKVVKILIYYGVDDPCILSATYWHDIPEDVSEEILVIIWDGYPKRVYSIVRGVTKEMGMTEADHFAIVAQEYDRILLKLGDRLHNLRNMAKNLYSSRKFTRKRLMTYRAETIKYIFPLGERISRSDYKYARAAARIYDAIIQAIFVTDIVLDLPRKVIMRYQRSRRKLDKH